jgi:hypothetical protein
MTQRPPASTRRPRPLYHSIRQHNADSAAPRRNCQPAGRARLHAIIHHHNRPWQSCCGRRREIVNRLPAAFYKLPGLVAALAQVVVGFL